jgi:hypothetical protein
MSDFTGWTLDPTRGEYYYYSQREGAYIYQNGERIYTQGVATATGGAGGGGGYVDFHCDVISSLTTL